MVTLRGPLGLQTHQLCLPSDCYYSFGFPRRFWTVFENEPEGKYQENLVTSFGFQEMKVPNLCLALQTFDMISYQL